MSTELTEIESSRLKECELVIRTGLETFYQVGQALSEIKESNLYRQEFKNFDDYLKERWGFGIRQGQRLIQSFEVIDHLRPIGRIPENLEQTKYLSKLEPELRAYVWNSIINTFEHVTGKIVDQEVRANKQLNEVVKEIKDNPVVYQYQFNTTDEMIEKAKSLITMPEPQVIEVIKQDESLIKSLADKDTKIADLQKRIVQQSDSNLELQSKLQDHDNKIADFNKTIKELEQAKLKLTEYEDLRKAQLNIVNLKAQRDTLFKNSENIQQILSTISEGKRFFQQHILSLGALKVDNQIKRDLEPRVIELLDLIESWKFAITQNLLLSNNLLSV